MKKKTSHKVDITLKGGFTYMVPLHKNSKWEINKYEYQIKIINVELLAGIFFIVFKFFLPLSHLLEVLTIYVCM